ncbi:hypothetical protein FOZ61_009529 [Perkinsus olseni]|uniref:Uncharacterized protein n=1 Tax=Perkinsus olseni TaxID=32597 RepID=A0A7J6MWY2_PEROL|nr:hypothetical protein FOZ61_009529 [Perkinsus olseni]KAF4676128.1 hypothetical protein FOL46_007181 [Perkinsus olseni]
MADQEYHAEPRNKHIVGGFTNRVSVPKECSRRPGDVQAPDAADSSLCLGASREQGILDKVKDQVFQRLAKTGYNGMVSGLELDLRQYATQVVAGVNHNMWVQLKPHKDVILVRVFEPLYADENGGYEVTDLTSVDKVGDGGVDTALERAVRDDLL